MTGENTLGRPSGLIDVIHFQRLPGRRGFSIERLFDDLRAAMPPDIRCRKQVSPHPSQGFRARFANIRHARAHRGPVNHITGDVHFLALGLPGRNTVLTVHDCGILHRSRGPARWLLRLFWYVLPVARCRVVTAISEATKRELVELTGVRPEKIRVIPDCVSPEFVRVPTVFNAVRPTLLLVGVAPNKNLERIAAALAGLACTVELVGQPSPAQAAAFSEHGVVLRPLGNCDNAAVLAAYRRCDLLLFASVHEGFGLPILEAQATGRPVVTGNCSSMAEVAGDSACLVDPFSPESIRAGVARVIADAGYRALLVQRGRENVRRFHPAVIAEAYAAIYRELGGSGRPASAAASPAVRQPAGIPS